MAAPFDFTPSDTPSESNSADKTTPTNRLAPSAESAPAPFALEDATVEAAAPFVGRWQTLVSTTNWEKGRIIAEWRAEREAADEPVTHYSDEAWATLVGNVTSQHVGRLRRVHARFGETYQTYEGLYWSHFQAALEWDDAEMWLEGAVQNGWSISQMRAKRWEVVGDDKVMPEAAPEDGEPGTPGWQPPSSAQGGTYNIPEEGEGEPTKSETAEAATLDADDAERSLSDNSAPFDDPAAPAAEPVRPFADLPELPDDLADAFEQFKLAIVTHRLTGWQEASLEDVLASLDALKRLASAPVEKPVEKSDE